MCVGRGGGGPQWGYPVYFSHSRSFLNCSNIFALHSTSSSVNGGCVLYPVWKDLFQLVILEIADRFSKSSGALGRKARRMNTLSILIPIIEKSDLLVNLQYQTMNHGLLYRSPCMNPEDWVSRYILSKILILNRVSGSEGLNFTVLWKIPENLVFSPPEKCLKIKISKIPVITS